MTTMVGIVFLEAIARGYFDDFADIGIVLFKRPITPTCHKKTCTDVQVFAFSYSR